MELFQILVGFDGLYHQHYRLHRHLLEMERKGPHLCIDYRDHFDCFPSFQVPGPSHFQHWNHYYFMSIRYKLKLYERFRLFPPL